MVDRCSASPISGEKIGIVIRTSLPKGAKDALLGFSPLSFFLAKPPHPGTLSITRYSPEPPYPPLSLSIQSPFRPFEGADLSQPVEDTDNHPLGSRFRSAREFLWFDDPTCHIGFTPIPFPRGILLP